MFVNNRQLENENASTVVDHTLFYCTSSAFYNVLELKDNESVSPSLQICLTANRLNGTAAEYRGLPAWRLLREIKARVMSENYTNYTN